MKHITKQLGYTLVSVVAVLGLTALPVSAMPGNGRVAALSAGAGASAGAGQSRVAVGAQGSAAAVNTRISTLQNQAKGLLQTARKTGTVHSQAARQKACEMRQKGVDTITNNFATSAQTHLNVFTSIFTKLQTFYTSKQLNVTGYSALVATATADQTAAQTAVSALKSLDVQINCSQPDPASAVATIQQAASGARTALHAYLVSLKNLVVALKGASTAQHTTASTTTNANGSTATSSTASTTSTGGTKQ